MYAPHSLRRQLRGAYVAVAVLTAICAVAAVATALVSQRVIGRAMDHEIPQLQRVHALSNLVDKAISHVFFELSAQDRAAFDTVSARWQDIAQPMTAVLAAFNDEYNADLTASIRERLSELQSTRNAINFAVNERLHFQQQQQDAVRLLGRTRLDILQVIDTLAEITHVDAHHNAQHRQLDELKRIVESYAPTLLALPTESRVLQIELARVRTRSFVLDATATLQGLPDKPVAFLKRGFRVIQDLGDGEEAIPALRLAELDINARAAILRNNARHLADRIQADLARLLASADQRLQAHVVASGNTTWQLAALVSVLAIVSLVSVAWFQTEYLEKRLVRPLASLSQHIQAFEHGGTVPPLPTLPDNEVRALAHTFQAAAEQKAAHEARLDAQNRELTALNAQLSNANREQFEFSYAVSHDLKSPINTLSMLLNELDAIDPHTEPATHAHFLTECNNTLDRMRQLIEGVLRYASTVENRQAREHVDLDAILVEVLDDLSADIRSAGARITHAPLGQVQGNPFQLRMLMQNLIANAVKFRHAERAPEIAVRAVQPGTDAVVFEVADNGIGIDPAHHDTVFSMFRRLHSESEFEGSGLGLAVCKRIASNHNGSISVGARAAGGSVFRVSLPARPLSSIPDTAPRRAA
ncbi:MAG: ATP-binding protein [Pseudomonadota bacterium]